MLSHEVSVKTSVPKRPLKTDKKLSSKSNYFSVTSAQEKPAPKTTRIQGVAPLASWARQRHTLPQRAPHLPPPAAAVKPPAITPVEEVMIAFEGWVEQVADGAATLRLVDAQGRRSVATYAVADLERDCIPAEAGTAFRCQVVRNRSGFQISFQPVSQRTLSELRRKQREARAIAAYSTLQNDY